MDNVIDMMKYLAKTHGLQRGDPNAVDPKHYLAQKLQSMPHTLDQPLGGTMEVAAPIEAMSGADFGAKLDKLNEPAPTEQVTPAKQEAVDKAVEHPNPYAELFSQAADHNTSEETLHMQAVNRMAIEHDYTAGVTSYEDYLSQMTKLYAQE
jgi:hypothetical protein